MFWLLIAKKNNTYRHWVDYITRLSETADNAFNDLPCFLSPGDASSGHLTNNINFISVTDVTQKYTQCKFVR